MPNQVTTQHKVCSSQV